MVVWGEDRDDRQRDYRIALETRSDSPSVGQNRGDAILGVPFGLMGGGRPRSGIPDREPVPLWEMLPGDVMDYWDFVEANEDQVCCANCGRENHTVARCMIPMPDGFVHGCVFCNTRMHDTMECIQFPGVLDEQVAVLVSDRANMPPLYSPFWVPFLFRYRYKNPGAQIEEGFPWTVEFAKESLRNPDVGIWAVDAMEPGLAYARPVDPETKTWEEVWKAFQAEMASLGELYRGRNSTRPFDKVREMIDWIKDEPNAGERRRYWIQPYDKFYTPVPHDRFFTPVQRKALARSLRPDFTIGPEDLYVSDYEGDDEVES
ncbi:hypothetical protein FSARC_7919 [Fusarium sarcochroum]|uniref:Uncharacterized protein n=1 Tax=Fusarium sarcochroum TaxID=1208366 RepID=A0A8H4TUA0_9HYPO|nr:hypothetical protein FSARC_7919 [Fusarium sarcochroum]